MKECCGTCKYLGSEYDIACTKCNPDCGESGYEPSEEFIELERLAEIGKATISALQQGHIIIVPGDNNKLSKAIWNEGSLLEWHRKEME